MEILSRLLCTHHFTEKGRIIVWKNQTFKPWRLTINFDFSGFTLFQHNNIRQFWSAICQRVSFVSLCLIWFESHIDLDNWWPGMLQKLRMHIPYLLATRRVWSFIITEHVCVRERGGGGGRERERIFFCCMSYTNGVPWSFYIFLHPPEFLHGGRTLTNFFTSIALIIGQT